MPRALTGRPSITGQLDRDVYQVVRKIAGDSSIPRLSEVYQSIKNSNSSLNRRSKKALEDSIERVLNVLRADQEEESDSGSIAEEMAGDPLMEDSNAMNRSIVGTWSKATPSFTNGTGNSSAKHQHPETPDAGEKTRRNPAGEPQRKKQRTIQSSIPTNINFDDLGGMDQVIDELEQLVLMPIRKPHFYTSCGIQPPRGILLHGPPGCGKTMLANALAAEIRVPFISISAPSVVSGMSGESEKALREHFEEAKKLAPCIMFIDEIDAITPKRDSAQREMEKRIVAQLLTCMDDLALEKTGGKPVIVLAATNRPDSLDPALRRGGRFDKEVNLNVPSRPVRIQILQAMSRKITLSADVDFDELALKTPGFVGADLKDLVSTAGSLAMTRKLKDIRQQAQTQTMDVDNSHSESTNRATRFRQLDMFFLEDNSAAGAIQVCQADFLKALPGILPSLQREGFATTPNTTWEDVGALSDIRKTLERAIVNQILHPERYARVGITSPSGVLLWGPPGCGKTLIARATANASKANFISIKGPELLNKFVGESERAVRQVFERAKASAPCIIFFDELDALAPKRDAGMNESSARVVNTLLTELDGLDSREGIYVVAATNRPDVIDPAMLRPGRLEHILYVGLPSTSERIMIFETLLKRMKLGIQLDDTITKVATDAEGFSGADLASVVRQAGLFAIDRMDEMKSEDFKKALEQTKPSIEDERKYRLRRAL